MKIQLQKDTCTPIFIAALLTIAKIWNQRKCPLTDEQIKEMEYIYTGILLSLKKNETMPFAATRMDLEIIILREVPILPTMPIVLLFLTVH